MYYVRHGESEANLLGLWAGSQSDSPLTELGIQQAVETGKKLKEYKISRIISSPLARAHRTALEIAKEINFDISKIELEPRIVEYDLGFFSGQSKVKLNSEILRSNNSVEIPEIFRARVLSFLKELSMQSYEETLVVAHGGVRAMIEMIKNNGDAAKFIEVLGFKNAEFIKYDLSFLSQLELND